jgi:hypothetical protein
VVEIDGRPLSGYMTEVQIHRRRRRRRRRVVAEKIIAPVRPDQPDEQWNEERLIDADGELILIRYQGNRTKAAMRTFAVTWTSRSDE